MAEDGVVDGEVEGDDGVAAVDVLEGLDKVTGVGVSAVIPSVGVATLPAELRRVPMPDNQVECDGGVAAVDCIEVLSVVT